MHCYKSYQPGKVNSECSELYANRGYTGTGSLAITEVPKLIKKYCNGKTTLDYGCGAGRSSLFLKEFGLEPIGVDISYNMLKHCRPYTDHIKFMQINSAQLPFADNSFDLAFSCLVMPEISSLQHIKKIFVEINRILKKGSVFIVITTSKEMYCNEWVSLKTNYPQNKMLKKGGKAKILLKNINLEIEDFYWELSDYKYIALSTKFTLIETIKPLAPSHEHRLWKSETKKSPYTVMVFKKN